MLSTDQAILLKDKIIRSTPDGGNMSIGVPKENFFTTMAIIPLLRRECT